MQDVIDAKLSILDVSGGPGNDSDSTGVFIINFEQAAGSLIQSSSEVFYVQFLVMVS